jgi:hypothetical protein
MKPKKKGFKLTLNKSTIASLDNTKLSILKGGGAFTIWLTNCDACTVLGTCDGCVTIHPIKCLDTEEDCTRLICVS